MGTGSLFPASKAPSSAEVTARVELYLCTALLLHELFQGELYVTFLLPYVLHAHEAHVFGFVILLSYLSLRFIGLWHGVRDRCHAVLQV